jgi:hypothetical protein
MGTIGLLRPFGSLQIGQSTAHFVLSLQALQPCDSSVSKWRSVPALATMRGIPAMLWGRQLKLLRTCQRRA